MKYQDLYVPQINTISKKTRNCLNHISSEDSQDNAETYWLTQV